MIRRQAVRPFALQDIIRKEQESVMDKNALRKNWAKDCLPAVFALLLSGLYSIVDGLFIGRAVGDAGLAAVNIAWPLPAFVTAVGVGSGMGGSILYSNCRGMGEGEKSSKIYGQTVTLLIVEGLFITGVLYCLYPQMLRILGASGDVSVKAGDYSQVIILGAVFQTVGTGIIPILRNRGRALGAVAGMSAGMLVNLVLNYILIFRFSLGVRGAALGTVAAQLVTALTGFFLIYGKEEEPLKLTLDRKTAVHILRTGASAFGLSLAPSLILVFTNQRCLQYGGGAAVACYAVISYITFPVQYILSGIGDGSQPLMSYYCGGDRMEELAYIRSTGERFAAAAGLLLALLVYAVKPVIPDVFGLSRRSAAYFDTGMTVSSTAFFVMGPVKFHIAYMNSVLRIKDASRLIYGETLIAMPVLLFILPEIWGINGVWAAFPAGQLIMLLIFNICFTRRKSRLNTAVVRCGR